MKRQLKCVISAAITVLLLLGISSYAYEIGKEVELDESIALEAAQSEVLVQDFIHDNYVISEKNPWTDYGFHPIQYSYDKQGRLFHKDVSAKGAVVIDYNNKTVIYEKNSNQRMYPASTTKLMTALTVLQHMNLTDVIVVGKEIDMIAPDSSVAGFSKGQAVTVEELLQGMLLASGNDAAYVLANATGKAILENNIENEGRKFNAGQCVKRFVYEMNKNTRDMELDNTHFTTPDGYDDDEQYISAIDLSKIAIQAYENETISSICSQEKIYSKTLGKYWKSTNQMIDKNSQYYFEGCKGLKTGSTTMAGKCFVSVGERDGKRCVSVVLNADTEENRWKDTRKLLEFGFNE